jgi:diacylglycerol kinase (ATP)
VDPRAYVIINRRARGLRKAGPLLAEQCRARATVRVFETRTLDELDEAARQIAKWPAAVVLGGGDGSHGAGITALERAFGERSLPPIALAPGGTVNTIARGWGLRGDAVAYTRRLLASVEAGTAARTRRPTLRITREKIDGLNDVPSSRARVAFIFGAGLISRFFEIYDAKGAPGLATAASITARVFAGSFFEGKTAKRVLTPSPCELAIDGVPASFERVSLLCASVIEDLGLGMRLMYRAGESFERFHVVATPQEPRALGPQMPRVLLGRPLEGERIDALASSLSLRFPSGTGAYVVDGELLRSDHVVVTPGPILELLEP